MSEHWSRQEIVKTIINAMVEAKGDVKAVPAGKAADHILAYLEPIISKGERLSALVEEAREGFQAIAGHDFGCAEDRNRALAFLAKMDPNPQGA